MKEGKKKQSIWAGGAPIPLLEKGTNDVPEFQRRTCVACSVCVLLKAGMAQTKGQAGFCYFVRTHNSRLYSTHNYDIYSGYSTQGPFHCRSFYYNKVIIPRVCVWALACRQLLLVIILPSVKVGHLIPSANTQLHSHTKKNLNLSVLNQFENIGSLNCFQQL